MKQIPFYSPKRRPLLDPPLLLSKSSIEIATHIPIPTTLSYKVPPNLTLTQNVMIFLHLKHSKLWIFGHLIISNRDHGRQQLDSDSKFANKEEKKLDGKGGKRTLMASAWIFVIVRRGLGKVLQILWPICKLRILPYFTPESLLVNGSINRYQTLNFLSKHATNQFASKLKCTR